MLKTRLYSAIAFLIAFTIGVGLGQLPLRRPIHSPISDSFCVIPAPIRLTAVAMSPDGHFVVSGDAAGHVCLWEAHSQHLIWSKQLNRRVLSLAFSPTDQTLTALTEKGQITNLNVKTGCIERQTQPLPQFGIEGGAIQYTSAGDSSVMVYGGAPLRNWATINGRENRLHPFDSSATCITWSILANRYALGNQSGQVKLFDKTTFTEIKCWNTPFESIQTVGLSPKGTWLAVAGKDGTEFINLQGEKTAVPDSIGSATAELTCLAFSDDEAKLIAGNQDGMILVWSIDSNGGGLNLRLNDHWQATQCCQDRLTRPCSTLTPHRSLSAGGFIPQCAPNH